MSTALSTVPGWYIEFQAALLRQAPRPGEIDQATAEKWTSNQKGLKKNLTDCLLSSAKDASIEQFKFELLFEAGGSVNTSSTTKPFVVTKQFVMDTSREAKVPITYIGDNFEEWFGAKIEKPTEARTLRYRKLLKATENIRILTLLGGETKVEITLSEIYDLMDRQARRMENALYSNGWANIFYARDASCTLRTILLFWRDGGWEVNAFSIQEAYDEWNADSQVFYPQTAEDASSN